MSNHVENPSGPTPLGVEVEAVDRATQIYEAMLPAISGQPIEAVSRAMLTHLGVMIDQAVPDSAQARKACVDVGEQLWGMVLMTRKRRAAN